MYYALIVLGTILLFGEKAPFQFEPRLIGKCEGCEAVLEFGNRELHPTDTLPGFENEGVRICVKGTVYKADGRTPAPGVVLYLYQTNSEGIYQATANAKGWGRRHGYIRSWIRTDDNGNYAFYTTRPGTYPSRSEPAHIHLTILEPDGKYYWLGSYHFLDDPLLTEKELSPVDPRGGSSGVLDLKYSRSILTGTRDIILGKNIPGYR